MGYVETLDRETLHVRAHEPVDVIQDLHDRSERLSTVASSIEELWEETPVAEHDVTVTKRAETVVDYACDLIREADTTVDIAATVDEFRAFEEALAAIADSDVVVRVSLDSADRVDDSLEDEVVRDAITELRVREFSAPLVVAVDGETACFAPTGRVPDPFGMTVKGDRLTLVFRWFFQTCLWTVWDPHPDYETERTAFASLREFVCEVYEAWEDGAALHVAVDGVSTDTGDHTSLRGGVTDIWYTGSEEADGAPALTDLSGEGAIVVAGDDRSYVVGGWGRRSRTSKPAGSNYWIATSSDADPEIDRGGVVPAPFCVDAISLRPRWLHRAPTLRQPRLGVLSIGRTCQSDVFTAVKTITVAGSRPDRPDHADESTHL